LQAVISAAQAGGTISQLYIPTPEAVASSLQYEQLYPRHFAQPATYIRFSSTVEDCIGCPYCMTAEDEVFLKIMNQKKAKSLGICSEDEFEIVMNFFEETAASKQPFASVDPSAPILGFEEMEAAFDESMDEACRRFAKEIYEHWKSERSKNENKALMPSLKFETNLETDDSDPFVCFRRREVRQVRKTRGRDAQVTEKLKKLRRELEEARRLMAMVKQREVLRREILSNDRQIFEHRTSVKEAKRNLGIKGDDEDLLINQKVRSPLLRLHSFDMLTAVQPVQKPKPKVDASVAQRGIPGMGMKPQLARATNLPESDLVSLQEQKEKKDEEIQRFIDENLHRHQAWNKGYVDLTWRPITPPLEQAPKSGFRAAKTEFLPTPPASDTSEQSGENANADEGNRRETRSQTRRASKTEPAAVVRYASPPEEKPFQGRPSFRRRVGRGGRMMIDRRGIKRPREEDIDEVVLDRFKFDRDSDEDDELYPVDHYDTAHMRYRVIMGGLKDAPSHRRNLGTQHISPAHNRSASGHLLPPSGGPG
jgi:enhancer of polycomb-like protein